MTRALDAARLASIPRRVPRVRQIVVRERTGSTNDDARALASGGAPSWTVVIAGSQEAGRGRFGRPWHSPAGLGLYASVLLRPGGPPAEIARWTLAAAVAAAEACAASGAVGVTIKWPNDLLASGRKLAGILAEMRTAGAEAVDLVLGAGFNVHQEEGDFPEGLRSTASSLKMAGAGSATDREGLVESWLARLAEADEALERGAWEPVADRFRTWAPGVDGAKVRVVTSGGADRARTGVTRGLDPTGALRVETGSGETFLVRAGESVEPLEDCDAARGGHG